MGWRAGAEFTMMEKSVRAEFSASGRSYPPYGAGNNHNTGYGASVIDSEGKEIPYTDRDGKIITDFEGRFKPSPGQKFFLKGGSVDMPKYSYRGHETLPYSEMIEKGYKLPIYADLTSLPILERKAIWGMMIGEEGKTKIPILRNYTEMGFNPERDVIQCYGTGWKSAEFLPDERQLFGLPGGFLNDWKLRSNLEGLFLAGDSLYTSNCYGHAAATGHYAGRHCAQYAKRISKAIPDKLQVRSERERILRPLNNNPSDSIGWKELNLGISKVMKNYCGELKYNDLLKTGLHQLEDFEQNIMPRTFAYNPHELMRLLEVYDILTVSSVILNACLLRKSSSKPLNFSKPGQPEKVDADKLITLRQVNGPIIRRELKVDFYGGLRENYEKHNKEYIS